MGKKIKTQFPRLICLNDDYNDFTRAFRK